MSETLTAQQRLDRAAAQARTESAATADRAVQRAVRAEQRRIDAEARREREAETMAHYRSEFAAVFGIAHLPRAVTDEVFDFAYREAHSDGWSNVESHYGEVAGVVLAAFDAGKAAKQ